jgi:hypothetical protein
VNVSAIGLVFGAEILRCVSRRIRSEANAREKASAHFAQDDNLGYDGALLVAAEVDVEIG